MADQLQLQIGADTSGLQQGLNRAEKAVKDFDATARRSTAAVGQAGASLQNLGRIASDLPFGFIAIQNNLQPLVDSFGSLRQTAGGTGGALRALAGSLIGPAGLGVAFAAISTALTVAIQKYGSFGAAVQALTGGLSEQEKAVNTLNKELVDNAGALTQQIAKLEILRGLSEDASIGIESQAKASALLRQEVDGIIVSQDLLNSRQEEASRQTLDYAKKVVAARVIFQGFNTVIAQTAVEYAKAVTEGVTFTDFFVGAVQKINSFILALKGGNFTLAAQIAQLDFANLAQKRYEDRVNDLQQSVANSIGQLNNFTRAQIAAGIQIDDLFGKEIKAAKETKTARDENAAAARREGDALKYRNEQVANFARLVSAAKADEEITKQFTQENPAQAAPQQGPFSALGLIQGQLALEKSDKAAAAFQERIKGLVTDFNDLLGPAISTVFGAIENGQNIFKALGQSLKALVVQLVATVAKAAILAAILSIIPGAGAALGVAGAASGAAGGFGGLFRNFLPSLLGGGGGIGRSAAPTFSGGGLSPSGFQLAGQVVFVQRGTDLVGVLNQGNARIGRVG
jgi:hypothetical protein